MLRRRTKFVGSLALLVVVGVGCGGSASSSTVTPAATIAWARPTPPGADSAVVYVTRSAGLGDAIVSADIPDAVATAIEPGATTPGHTHTDGHIGHLDAPPTAKNVATPTGEPLVLSGLRAPLTEGQHFSLTLSLSSGTTYDVDVAVTASR